MLLCISTYIYIFSIYLHNYILFPGDAEQTQIFSSQLEEGRQEDGNTTPWSASALASALSPPCPLLAFWGCDKSQCQSAASSEGASQTPHPAPSTPPNPPSISPVPSNQGAGGEMLGAGMRGCQATAASPYPVPPPPSVSSPRDPAALLPALPAQLNSRGEPRSMGTAARLRPCHSPAPGRARSNS